MIPDTMPDVRKAILDELERRGMSRYKLVKLLKGKRPGGGDVTEQTVYTFLRGDSTLNSDDLGLIFDALGLEIKPRHQDASGLRDTPS